MSEFLKRGLEDKRERLSLVICLLMAAIYVISASVLLLKSTRFDLKFLAARNERLLEIISSHPVSIGRPVAVNSETVANHQIALLDGWSAPETDGAWTIAHRAYFAVKLPTGRPPTLTLDVKAALQLDVRGKQTIRIIVHGISIGYWELASPRAALCVGLPQAVIRSNEPLTVELDIGKPVRPPGGNDPRALGLKLQAVTIDHAGC